jgi:nicotinamidase/pyrazinamidase
MTVALLLIDLQNDFLPGGALAVPEGDRVIPVANRAMKQYGLVVATQDWHPPDHRSFASQHPGHRVGEILQLDGIDQVLWPDHCIQDTSGADFAPGLLTGKIRHVIYKGTDPKIDSYSGFFDNARRKQTELDAFLRSQAVDQVHILGLATDYCVQFTALDAVSLGYQTYVIVEGCRGVNLQSSDSQRALKAMQEAGVVLQ